MAQPAAPTGPGRDAAAADGLVWAACFAAALLVAQQVAAKATRDALFLSNFPVTALPIVSGLTAGCSLLGVLVFSRGMARSSPPVIMRWGLAANATLLVAAWSLALAAPPLAAVAVYLLTGVFGATLISGFWSVVNERFDPHTARRVVGRIGTGASLGGVLGGLLTWRAAALIGVPNMLLAMAALTLACLAVLETGNRTADSPPSPPMAPSVPPGATYAFHLIRARPYLRNVALLIGLCALTEAVLDFLLSAAATTRFTSGGALISFFALYHTTVGLLALGVQTAVARHSLERLGLGGTLGVQPAVVALGGLAAALMPAFWLRVGLRGAQGVLRNSLFRSAYELLFTPLPPHEKRPTKALLDVGADRLGTIAGSVVVMAILVMPAGAATRALLLLASGLAALTLLLARRLQRGYVGALAESLRAGTVRLDPDEAMDQTTRAMLTAAAAPPRAPEPVKAAELPAGSESDPLLEAAATLRSRDDARVRTVLRDAALSPALVRFVVPLLAYDGLFTEAVTALRRLAARCTGELVDVLLDPEEDPVVRRRVPRVLKVVRTQRAVDGLLAALRDERFDVRYRSAQALLRMQEDRSLSIPAAEAFSAVQCELARSGPTSRGLEHVFRLLALALPGEPLPVALRAWRRGDASLRGTAREYLENVLPPAVSAALRPWLGAPPPSTNRGLDEVRDDLLRSTATVGLGRRSRTGTGRRG